ncbi:MAG: protein kinase [Xanthomonadales bacterium]|jgi:tetratricopeptide (TPR) repeat protein|nr:protein kinase [Xanthomonadales bacterium]
MTGPDAAIWEEVEALFEQLAELPARDRVRTLEQLATRHHPAAVGEVRRLLLALARHPELDDELRAPSLERDFAPGSLIGEWVVDGTLGRGGQGVVLRVHRGAGEFRQPGALKTLATAAPDPEGLRRLLRERQLLAGLSHPGLPAFLDGGVLDDGTPWFVQAYIEGERLDQWTKHRRPDQATRIGLLRQLTAVLIHAHGHLVLHRDLKPGNVLVDADDRAVLLDFGVASWLPAAQTRTQAGYTPAYAAPEQIRGERGSAATDVYGLGALALELLGGRPPFAEHRDTAAQLRAVLEQAPRLPADLDADLRAILDKALRKEPQARYQSIAALDADLARWQRGLPVEAHAGGHRYRFGKWLRRHRLAVGAALAVLLALSLGLAGALQQREQARQQQLAAERAQRQAEQTLAVLVDLFVSAGSGNLSGRWRPRDLQAGTAVPPRTGLSVREIIDLAVEERLPDIEPAIRAPLHEAFAEVYASLGQAEAAIRQFRAALALKPGDPALRAGLLKQLLQRATMAAEAMPELAALVANPGSLPRAELAAVIERGADAQRRTLKDLAAARALLDQALALYPERDRSDAVVALPASDRIALAHLLAQQGRIAIADRSFEVAATALDRADAILIALQGPEGEQRNRVLESRALLHAERGDLPAALAVREEQLRLLAQRPELRTVRAAVWFEIGVLHRQAKNYAESRAAYLQAQQLYAEAGVPPEAANRLGLRRSLANLLMDEQRYAEALAAYEALIADTPASMARILLPSLELSRARAQYVLGRHAEAIAGFSRLLSAAQVPEGAKSGARLGLAFSALQGGDASAAGTLLGQLDRSEDFDHALARAWLAHLRGKPADAADLDTLQRELRDPAARPDRVWLSGAPLRQLCPECPSSPSAIEPRR